MGTQSAAVCWTDHSTYAPQVTKILFSGLYHAADAVYSTVSGAEAAEVDAAVELFRRQALQGNTACRRCADAASCR